jgi:hypothetical protein
MENVKLMDQMQVLTLLNFFICTDVDVAAHKNAQGRQLSLSLWYGDHKHPN